MDKKEEQFIEMEQEDDLGKLAESLIGREIEEIFKDEELKEFMAREELKKEMVLNR